MQLTCGERGKKRRGLKRRRLAQREMEEVGVAVSVGCQAAMLSRATMRKVKGTKPPHS